MSQRESSSNIFISFSEFTRSIYIFSDDKKFLPVGKWIEGYICKSRAATTLRWKATRKGDRKKGSKEKVPPLLYCLAAQKATPPGGSPRIGHAARNSSVLAEFKVRSLSSSSSSFSSCCSGFCFLHLDCCYFGDVSQEAKMERRRFVGSRNLFSFLIRFPFLGCHICTMLRKLNDGRFPWGDRLLSPTPKDHELGVDF